MQPFMSTKGGECQSRLTSSLRGESSGAGCWVGLLREPSGRGNSHASPGMGRVFQLAHSQIHRELTAQIPYIAAAIRMASEISAYDGRRKLTFATWHSPLLANGSGSHTIIVADMLGGKEQYKCKQIISDEMLRYDASNIDSSQEFLSRGRNPSVHQ
jgi:hypothetical protein